MFPLWQRSRSLFFLFGCDSAAAAGGRDEERVGAQALQKQKREQDTQHLLLLLYPNLLFVEMNSLVKEHLKPQNVVTSSSCRLSPSGTSQQPQQQQQQQQQSPPGLSALRRGSLLLSRSPKRSPSSRSVVPLPSSFPSSLLPFVTSSSVLSPSPPKTLVLLLVGLPASGKSRLCSQILEQLEESCPHVSRRLVEYDVVREAETTTKKKKKQKRAPADDDDDDDDEDDEDDENDEDETESGNTSLSSSSSSSSPQPSLSSPLSSSSSSSNPSSACPTQVPNPPSSSPSSSVAASASAPVPSSVAALRAGRLSSLSLLRSHVLGPCSPPRSSSSSSPVVAVAGADTASSSSSRTCSSRPRVILVDDTLHLKSMRKDVVRCEQSAIEEKRQGQRQAEAAASESGSGSAVPPEGQEEEGEVGEEEGCTILILSLQSTPPELCQRRDERRRPERQVGNSTISRLASTAEWPPPGLDPSSSSAGVFTLCIIPEDDDENARGGVVVFPPPPPVLRLPASASACRIGDLLSLLASSFPEQRTQTQTQVQTPWPFPLLSTLPSATSEQARREAEEARRRTEASGGTSADRTLRRCVAEAVKDARAGGARGAGAAAGGGRQQDLSRPNEVRKRILKEVREGARTDEEWIEARFHECLNLLDSDGPTPFTL